MAGNYLVDTNILIAFLKEEAGVNARFNSILSPIHVPFIAIAELYYGARNSGRVEANLASVDALAARFDVLLPDTNTLKTYGEVRAGLKVIGRPMPEADIWISALALQHDLTLVTRDEHFRDVVNLRVERW